ncbi:segregation/condensation protein A [Rhodocytophaga aerolata]|uniref:Segregation and condensation protein A n=1 Tax=Rhodocytophaga aerolata TaxID=455078 RepID=A0ABT8R632_9BACT|nr:segregation/condensation protein A [Rhodocytophaga aerolata]MDO1447560.1 segregation/condensation protein A [Rhodocytophaga aerolata]
MTFEIKLPLFEGPFDLLLFFIERDELDIHDIPISKITDDFLAYVKQLEAINIDLASEFILVAATLMRIKAKMLLPRHEVDAQGNEIDPRAELVRHLLEYKKYKSVIGELATLEETRASKEARGNVVREFQAIADKSNVDIELQDLSLYKLLKVYQRVINRYEHAKNRPVHTVVQYPYTITQQKEYILTKLQEHKRVSFEEVILIDPLKIAVIYNFLAILELAQSGAVSIHIDHGFNNFWISTFEEEPIKKDQLPQ